MTEIVANKKILVVSLTAGDPSLQYTAKLIMLAHGCGADMVNICVPFSDPIAQDAAVSASHIRALKGGASLDAVFDMLEKVKGAPLMLTAYANPVFAYGYAPFFARCRAAGVSAVCITDMPFEECGEILPHAENCGVALIQSLAPCADERISAVCNAAKGFVLCVCGGASAAELKQKISARTSLPVLIDCGICGVQSLGEAANAADGAIAGGVVKIVSEYGEDSFCRVESFVRDCRRALSRVDDN